MYAAIYGNIHHQYTPVMLAYIPYMDPMGIVLENQKARNAKFFQATFSNESGTQSWQAAGYCSMEERNHLGTVIRWVSG